MRIIINVILVQKAKDPAIYENLLDIVIVITVYFHVGFQVTTVSKIY